jgi:hypothetical protein
MDTGSNKNRWGRFDLHIELFLPRQQGSDLSGSIDI